MMMEINTQLSTAMIDSEPIQTHHREFSLVGRVKFDQSSAAWPIDLQNRVDALIVLR